jgi:hypothetical protein
MALKMAGANIGEAVAVGAAHILVDSFYDKRGIDVGVMKCGAMSGGAALVGDIGGNMVLPMVAGGSGSMQAIERQFLPPLLSGAAYVAMDSVLRWDGRTPMYKFLEQMGTHMAVGWLYVPVRNAITGGRGY